MSANYKKLGDYITQRREKNTAINLPICGVCREGLIPPKQQDADISLYNVFYKNDFIFNPARMELNSITLNTEYDKAICSSLYEIFYINDTSKLLPEFLFVQLKTDNFVRFCEFQGQGSVREYCRFANISEYPVIVPDLKEQEKIVNTYNAITKRIQLKQKINENLEKTAQCLFDELFMGNNDDLIELNEIIEVNPERTLKKGEVYKYFDMSSLPTENAIPFEYELKEYNGGMKFRNGDTLMARITPCLENGKAAYINLLDEKEIAFGSTYIKKFGRNDLDEELSIMEQMFKLLHAVERRERIELTSKYFSRKLLEYLYEKNVFMPNNYNDFDGYNDFEFLLKMFNKVNKADISDAQHRKTTAIIMKSILPYLRKRLKTHMKSN